MKRSLLGALISGAFVIAGLAGLTACSVTAPPTVVTLEVLGKRNAPTDAAWAAAADVDGVWHELTSSWPGTYQVRADGRGRYAIAVGCASAPPTVTVFQGTAKEGLTLTAKCEAEDESGCGEASLAAPAPTVAADAITLPQAGALLYGIDVAGLAPGEKAFAYFHGDPVAFDEAMGRVNVSMGRDNVLFFTLLGPETAPGSGRPDPGAVTALHYAVASAASPDIHVVASGEGSNVTVPDHGTATVTGANGDTLATKATLKLPHMVRVPLGKAGSDALTYHMVPAALGDLVHEATIMLSTTALGPVDASGGQPVRSSQANRALGAPPDTVLALPTTLLAGARRAADGTVRWRAYSDADLGKAQAYRLTATVGPAGAPTLVWQAELSRGWLAQSATGTSQSFSYRLPELSGLVGDGWLIPDGATGTWQLDALMGRLADGSPMDVASLLGGHGAETAGSSLFASGRTGPL